VEFGYLPEIALCHNAILPIYPLDEQIRWFHNAIFANELLLHVMKVIRHVEWLNWLGWREWRESVIAPRYLTSTDPKPKEAKRNKALSFFIIIPS
jgi:hypothetical protein